MHSSRALALAALLATLLAGAPVVPRASASEAPRAPDGPATGPDAAERAPDLTTAYVPGRILVGWDADTSARSRARVRSQQALASFRTVSRLDRRTDVVELPPGTSVAKAIATWSTLPGVRFVEPDYRVQAVSVPNDPSYTATGLWGMRGPSSSPASAYGSRADAAWAAGHTGSSDVHVVVIDEGLQPTHPDLAANVWTNPGEVAGNGRDDDGNGFVDDVHGWDFYNDDATVYDGPGLDDHGTHVAGTIGGVGDNGTGVVGVNWDVTMISAKFLGAGGGSIADAIRAVDYATDLKTQHGIDIVATSNSWGGGEYSQALLDAIERGGDAGILFIAAAGNESAAQASFPARYVCDRTAAGAARGWDCVVSVASITSTGALSSFSNRGAATVDLGAPGSGVLSTVGGGTYDTYSGTSMATPHVTGAVALCASADPTFTARDLRGLLLGSVAATPSLATTTGTGGRLDVARLLEACGGDRAPMTGGPTDLAVTDVGLTTIDLTWVDDADGEDVFEVQAATGDCTLFATVATATAAATSVTVEGLEQATEYCLRVRATQFRTPSQGGPIDSAWAGPVSATTEAPFVQCSSTTYGWVDGVSSGTRHFLGDDDWVSVPLGFAFPYFDDERASLLLSSNGFLATTGAAYGIDNAAIPDAGEPNGLIAPFWDDLNPSRTGSIWTRTLGSVGDRRFVATWQQVPHYYYAEGAVTFQVVLSEADRSITFSYQDVTFGSAGLDAGASATVGVESPDGLEWTQVSFDTPSLAAGTSIRCEQGPPPLEVTTLELPAGTVGSAYAATLEASGGSGDLVWSTEGGALPDGITLDADGTLSGTPDAAGTSTFLAGVAGDDGTLATRELALVVREALTIQPIATVFASAGDPVSLTLRVDGGLAPYTWSLQSGTLPEGVTLSGALLSGAPIVDGSFPVVLRAVDAEGRSATAPLELRVGASDKQPSIDVLDVRTVLRKRDAVPTVTVTVVRRVSGSAFAGVRVEGTWRVVGRAETTVVSGMTGTDGTVLLGGPTLRRALGQTVEFCLTSMSGTGVLPSSADPACASRVVTTPLTVTTSSVRLDRGHDAEASLTATGGVPDLAWSLVAGALPDGVTLSADGTLAGTPAELGDWTATVRVTDGGTPALEAERTIAIAVREPSYLTADPVVVTTRTKKGRTSATAVVTVRDASTGAAVRSVTVEGEWSRSDDPSWTASASAASAKDGRARIASPQVSVPAGTTFTFCVTDLRLTGRRTADDAPWCGTSP